MYLREPERFTRLGGRLPKGVLLTGPPGTGKTLLAKAIAGEAKVPFFYTSGSEFEEMFVGVGARRVRDLFEAAKAKAPCIIFIDEVDAIGGSRHLKDQSTMKMTLNQLLVEMDGFEQNNGIVVIAATNFPDSLDNALTRPGRLDKHVDVPLPDIAGRTAILNLYGSKVLISVALASIVIAVGIYLNSFVCPWQVPLSKDVDMDQLARGTPGFSGADLYNLGIYLGGVSESQCIIIIITTTTYLLYIFLRCMYMYVYSESSIVKSICRWVEDDIHACSRVCKR